MTDLGLSQQQLANASTIIAVGRNRHASTKDIETAVMVALDETSLQNYANAGNSESLSLPHENVGSDSDSVGLFQQRPSQGWGTTVELMDPATAASKFYDALDKVPNKDANLSWVNAQKVQRSFDPTGSNYLAQWPKATAIVEGISSNAQLVGDTTTAGTAPTNPIEAIQKVLSWVQAPANWSRIGLFVLGGFFTAFALWKLANDTGVTDAVVKGVKNTAEAVAVL